jgi:hypothetical protein
MAQEMKVTPRKSIVLFIALSLVLGFITFLLVMGGHCEELECIVNLTLAVPLSIVITGLAFLLQWLAWLYAKESKRLLLIVILELLFASIAGIILANILPGKTEALVRFVYIPISFYFAKTWWILLLIIVITILCLHFIQLDGTMRRFWFFLAIAALFPLMSNALTYTYVVNHLTDAEKQEAAQSWSDKLAAVDERERQEAELAQQAIASNNLAACYSLHDNNRASCIEHIAENRSDATLCSKIDVIDWKNACYTHFAVLNKDASYCDSVAYLGGYNNAQRGCVLQVAMAIPDVQPCYTLDKSDFPFCISSVAYVAKDPSICDLIDPATTNGLQESCRQAANATAQSPPSQSCTGPGLFASSSKPCCPGLVLQGGLCNTQRN